MKNVVIIGGGTGTFTLLKGLREFPTNNSVIVSTADDGGSTGRLRKDFGVIPPGDIRQCLVGLSYTDETLKELFNYRFKKGELKGHAAGNILLTALVEVTGNMEKAIAVCARILNVRGNIVSATTFPTVLSAKLEDGTTIAGEHEIDVRKKVRGSRIASISLKPSAPANPRALKLIREADVVVLGPGDVYTSMLPNLAVKGISDALKESNAKKVLIVNLMNKAGQTHGFTATDYISIVEKYIPLTTAIVNTQAPGSSNASAYKKAGSEQVSVDIAEIRKLGIEVLRAPLIAKTHFVKQKSDPLDRSVLRHDSNKLAKLIWEICN